MANTNAQAVAFANNRIRPGMDAFYGLYLTAKKIQQEWNSQSVAAAIPNDATVIADGAATDGRPQITNAQATSLITRCTDFVNFMEGSVGVSANDGSKAVLGTITVGEVNGRSSV